MKDIRYIIKRTSHFLKYGLHHSLLWARPKHRNWGDDLNPWLFEKLTGKKAVYCPHKSCRRFLMAGSILTGAGEYDMCWGTGLISDELQAPLKMFRALAVRGPLSAQKLEESGIEPPSIFGDPGLIATSLVSLPENKKYKVSIIPHYVDRKAGETFAKEKGFHVINVDLPIVKFMEEVASSEQVWSSSLHGIICSESLGLPTAWIKFSEKIIGGEFKFHDYLLGTQRKPRRPIELPNKNIDLGRIDFLEEFDHKIIIKNLISVFPYSLSNRSFLSRIS
ncbi:MULTISPECIES: polysaccharide pyruvyl transferase family protein [Cyanophyceae]|uniref:polysaccharide pyruvyl transferase family protein n=2 Tax=Cyanophyceae TaxID=3028117 RepID=UPI00016DC8DF|nr:MULTISPECIES: polysaccharide pyruvyl transferase family protein [Cyanophyceae]ACA99498.1 putative pyruvyltransferase [Picosynechococcus sp. PCC 7002]SMH30367.1 hypothetical protein SAMN06272755_0189 [Picosynechococcus sp. OG1]SMQ83880.1 hypothetical protein SAMN06272774_2565 [Synechococcus sp. 7002]